MTEISAYEQKRLENIERNRQQLESLNLGNIVRNVGIQKKNKPKRKRVNPKRNSE